MHARLQGGALYSYEILDRDKVIGGKSIHIDKKTRPWKETSNYKLLDDEREFNNAGDFITAYEAKKLSDQRDREWQAAAPETAKETKP